MICSLPFARVNVDTFPDLAYTPDHYSFYPKIKYPEFVRHAIPGKHKKEEVLKMLCMMRLEYQFLILHYLGQNIIYKRKQ